MVESPRSFRFTRRAFHAAAVIAWLHASALASHADFLNRRTRPPDPAIAGNLGTTTTAQPLISALPRWGGGCLWPFVNLYSGSLHLNYQALSAPAIGFDWNLTFHYNASLANEVSTLGRGWRHSYDAALLINVPAAGSITARWGDGRRDVYTFDGSGWAGPVSLDGRRIATIPGGYRLTTKHGDRYDFDTAGRLIRLIDRHSNIVTLAYTSGRLSTITDVSGRALTFSYDVNNRVATIGGMVPQFIQLSYTGDRLTAISESPGFPRTFAYDGLDRLVRTDDAAGRSTHIGYYGSLNVVTWVRASVARREFFYDQGTRTTAVRDSIGPTSIVQTEYVFNADGTCAQVKNPAGGTTANTYDPASLHPLTYTDGDGHTWTTTYDAVGDVLTTTDPTTAVTTHTYDPTFHLRTTTTDAAGKLWQWQRDGNGDVTTFVDPLLHATQFTYDGQGQIQSMTDPQTHITNFGWDGYGSLSQVMDPAGFTRQWAYDQRGHLTTYNDETGNSIYITRDSRDDPIQVNVPSTGTWTLEWDPSGTLRKSTDPESHETQYAYDALDRLVQTQFADGATVEIVPDGEGRPQTLESPPPGGMMGSTTEYSYDGLDRLTRRRDPEGNDWIFNYGPCDLDNWISPLGETTTLHYTPRHQMDSTRTADVVKSYSYDAVGRMVGARRVRPTEPTIAYAYVYDDAGRMTQKTSTHLSRTATFTYDDCGNVTRLADNLQPTPIDYTVNSRHLVDQLEMLPLDLAASYTPRRELNQLTYSPMGTYSGFNYDPLGRLTYLSTSSPGFSESYGLIYSARGDLTGMYASSPATSLSMTAAYDPVGRVLQESYTSGQTFDYTYDLAGNRLTKNGPAGFESYAYTTGHRLLSAGPLTQVWNARGAVTSATWPGNTLAYAYRADGSLATFIQNGLTWRFVPGPFGEIARVTVPGGGLLWHDYDVGPRGILRRAILTSPGTAPAQELGFLPGSGATPSFRRTAAATQPMVRGPSGISAVADGFGNLVGARFYSLFGELLASTGSYGASPGFLDMDVLQEPVNPYGVGLATSLGLANVSMDAPYLPRTGSLQQDRGPGPDFILPGHGDHMNVPAPGPETIEWWKFTGSLEGAGWLGVPPGPPAPPQAPTQSFFDVFVELPDILPVRGGATPATKPTRPVPNRNVKPSYEGLLGPPLWENPFDRFDPRYDDQDLIRQMLGPNR